MSEAFSNEQIKIFEEIAKSKNLRYHCSSGKKYFQIYPKNVPQSEGTGGLHYEFYKKNGNKYGLFIHVESRANNRDYKSIREVIFGATNKRKRTVYKEMIQDDKYVEEAFNRAYNKYEEKINEFYKKIVTSGFIV